MSSDKDIEILKLQIQLLEAQLAMANKTDKDATIAELRRKLDEPEPVVVRNISSKGTITKEMLESLSPGELFVLAKKKGIKVESIFPL